MDDPRGLKLEWANLNAERARETFGRQPARGPQLGAIHSLAEKSSDALRPLSYAVGIRHNAFGDEAPRNHSMPTAAAMRVWALTRINRADARGAVHHAMMQDQDISVRHVALQSVSLWRDEANSIHLAEFLHAGQPEQLRAIAARKPLAA